MHELAETLAEVAPFIEALAALAWPAILIVLLLILKKPIAFVVESAKSRGFTVKVAGNELTMEEVNAKQRSLIADLQESLGDMQAELAQLKSSPAAATAAAATAPAPVSPTPHQESKPKGFRVLWVDDNPKNNSYEVANLMEKGFMVDIAKTTADGLQLFSRNDYNLVLSDMGRKEGNEYVVDAGMRLVRTLREGSTDLPIGIYCGRHSVAKYKEEALRIGANIITASTMELMQFIDQVAKKR